MKRFLTAAVASSLFLTACGTGESPSPTESPKTEDAKQSEDAVIASLYKTYQDSLGKSGKEDSAALAKVDYTGDAKLLEPLATGAHALRLKPGKVVKTWREGDVAFIIHEFNGEDGKPLPNRGSKLVIKKDGEWKLALIPAEFEPDTFRSLAKIFEDVDVNEYGVNADAADEIGNTAEDKQDEVFTRVNAQTDYMALEMNSNFLMILGPALSNEENPDVLSDYYADYTAWYGDEQELLMKTAATGEDYAKYIDALTPLKESLQEKLAKYENKLNLELG
ncbi:hypothetical protein [Exiguobacterium flavidum]|uniref:hypothetical protein n=1 Tax=Exiguobacterium flavidum TaxID=2184695 RepID=UPI000DF83956|nr:hypothetical protein [Exiguobacterium flavidum]